MLMSIPFESAWAGVRCDKAMTASHKSEVDMSRMYDEFSNSAQRMPSEKARSRCSTGDSRA